MFTDSPSIVISPEVINRDILYFPYSSKTTTTIFGRAQEVTSGYTFGLYSGFSEILSGGTGGTSILTGLTIPIVLTQTFNDIGYYSEFDGFILQKDVVTNFLYSSSTIGQYTVDLYNTSGEKLMSFLQFSSYRVDWGDGSPIQSLNANNLILTHTYPNTTGNYTITLIQNNPWGITRIEKPITVPTTAALVPNPNGTITFTPQGGSWSGIPISYDYIYDFDSITNVQQATSNNFTTVPFNVSGYTSSRLNELKRYGPTPFTVGYVKVIKGQVFGTIDDITSNYTAYTINDINYFDLPNGKTFYIFQSSGITETEFVYSALTKNEYLMDFVVAPEIQTDVYVERGKYSAFENLQRLGEVDNIGDLINYGYGFFTVNNT